VLAKKLDVLDFGSQVVALSSRITQRGAAAHRKISRYLDAV